jgi:hypothetical protein
VYMQRYNVCSLHRNLFLKGRPWGGAYYLPSHHATIKGSNKMVRVGDLAGNVKAVNSCIQMLLG